MPDITITNGAAQYGYSVVTIAKPAQEDFFVSGSIAIKLKKAKNVLPLEDENQASYLRRVAAWNEQPFGEVDLTQEETDYLKTTMRTLMRERKIDGNEFGHELGMAIGLDKK